MNLQLKILFCIGQIKIVIIAYVSWFIAMSHYPFLSVLFQRRMNIRSRYLYCTEKIISFFNRKPKKKKFTKKKEVQDKIDKFSNNKWYTTQKIRRKTCNQLITPSQLSWIKPIGLSHNVLMRTPLKMLNISFSAIEWHP